MGNIDINFITNYLAQTYSKVCLSELEKDKLSLIISNEEKEICKEQLILVNNGLERFQRKLNIIEGFHYLTIFLYAINKNVFSSVRDMHHIVTAFKDLRRESRLILRPLVVSKMGQFISCQETYDFQGIDSYDFADLIQAYADVIFSDDTSAISERYSSIVTRKEEIENRERVFILGNHEKTWYDNYLGEITAINQLKSLIEDLHKTNDKVEAVKKGSSDNEFISFVSSVDFYCALCIKNEYSKYCDKLKNISLEKEKFNLYEQIGKVYWEFYILILHDSIPNIIASYITEFKSSKQFDTWIGRKLIDILSSHVDALDQQTKENVKTQLNPILAESVDLTTLLGAYELKIISKCQCVSQFQQLIQDFDMDQVKRVVTETQLPTPLQRLGLNMILSRLNFDSYTSEDFLYNFDCRCSFFFGSYGSDSFLMWLQSRWNLDREIVNLVTLKVIQNLTQEERWKLFETHVIKVLPTDDINGKIEELYTQNKKDYYLYSQSKNCLRTDCFQDYLISIILNANSAMEYDKLWWLCCHLTDESQKLINKENCEFPYFLIWINHLDSMAGLEWDLIQEYFYKLPDEQQISLFKYIFYCKSEAPNSLTDISVRLTNNGLHNICNTLKVVIFLLEKKRDNLCNHIDSCEIKKLLGVSDSDFSQSIPQLVHGLSLFFGNCAGRCQYISLPNVSDTVGEVTRKEIQGKKYYVISFYTDTMHYCLENEADQLEYELLCQRDANIAEQLELNISCEWDEENNEYLIPIESSPKVLTQLKLFTINKLIEAEDILGGLSLERTRHRYEDTEYNFCKCSQQCWSEGEFGVPFCWCDKKKCACKGRFFAAPNLWKNYKFQDLLYILYNQEASVKEAISDSEAELAAFLNEFFAKPSSLIQSKEINPNDEIPIDSDEMSIITEYCDYPDDDECDYPDNGELEYCDDLKTEPKRYDKYRDSFAQNQMGYSDDDIDEIFDGDPDAYWNID
jgi:hypothetical protein